MTVGISRYTEKCKPLLSKIFSYFPDPAFDDAPFQLNLDDTITKPVIESRYNFEHKGEMPETNIFDRTIPAVRTMLFKNTYRMWCLKRTKKI